MIIKAVYFFFLIGNTFFSISQDSYQRRHVKSDSFKYEFYVDRELSFKDKDIKNDLDYYWYKSKKILVTHGGVGGEALNGPLTKYYMSGQLAEKGLIHEGLKEGIWKCWYENGLVKSVYSFRNGKKHGDFLLLDSLGVVMTQGSYKKGNLVIDDPKPKKNKEGSKNISLKSLFKLKKNN